MLECQIDLARAGCFYLMSRQMPGPMGDMPQAKPIAIEQPKGFNRFLQSSNQPLAGNPVSVSERVIEERSQMV